MTDIAEVYDAIKRLQECNVAQLRELLQDEYSSEWSTKTKKDTEELIDLESYNRKIKRKLEVLEEMDLVQKEKKGRENFYSIPHRFPVQSKAPEILEQLKEIFRSDQTLYARAQKPIAEMINEIKSPYYIRQNVEDISHKENIIVKLEESIKSQKVIDLVYDGKTFLNVEPLKIAEFEGIWYLLLYYSNTFRKYQITGIDEITIKKETFEFSHEYHLEIDRWHNVWHQPSKKPSRITLLISDDVIKYFYQKNIFDINAYASRVRKCDEGIKYDVYITHAMEMLPTLMYWQPNVVIYEEDGDLGVIKQFKERLTEVLRLQSQYLT